MNHCWATPCRHWLNPRRTDSEEVVVAQSFAAVATPTFQWSNVGEGEGEVSEEQRREFRRAVMGLEILAQSANWNVAL